MDDLKELIILHEGLRLKPYTDTVGKLTIGAGRNLTDRGISRDEAYLMLDNDIAQCKQELSGYAWYTVLDEVRQGVLIELVFNVGLTKALGFKNMIVALSAKHYSTAATELLNSVWAKQVGANRSSNMAHRLSTGEY
jgi:lysozyme